MYERTSSVLYEFPASGGKKTGAKQENYYYFINKILNNIQICVLFLKHFTEKKLNNLFCFARTERNAMQCMFAGKKMWKFSL